MIFINNLHTGVSAKSWKLADVAPFGQNVTTDYTEDVEGNPVSRQPVS